MSDEKERHEDAGQRVDRHDAGGEPDFEGHRHEDAGQRVDRHDADDEPDFEGHRFKERTVE